MPTSQRRDERDGDAIRVCVDRALSVDQLLYIADLAADERADNAPPRPAATARSREERVRLAFATGKAWRPGRTLRISFLDGDPKVHARVRDAAMEWTKHANVGLEFCDDRQAEIRVAFRPGGSWSRLGTDARAVPLPKPTMNLGWLTPKSTEEELVQVVLHEFGHAIACIHEHQNPAAGIPWDREAVYAYYGRAPFGWSREDVDLNIFEEYAVDKTQFTEFDPTSIMVYPIPQDLTIGDFEVGWNSHLSETDKTFIGTLYPFPDTEWHVLPGAGALVDGVIDAAGKDVRYRFEVGSPARFVLSTSGSTDVAMELFGPDSTERLIRKDQGSGLGGNAKIVEFLNEGVYYVRVGHARATGTGKFRLSLERPA